MRRDAEHIEEGMPCMRLLIGGLFVNHSLHHILKYTRGLVHIAFPDVGHFEIPDGLRGGVVVPAIVRQHERNVDLLVVDEVILQVVLVEDQLGAKRVIGFATREWCLQVRTDDCDGTLLEL